MFDEPDDAHAIKAGDLDRDGDLDLVVGVNFGGASYVLLRDGDGWTRQELFAGAPFSIGDLELGDIDGDGALDVVAVDWGTTPPFGGPGDPGGPLRLWLGDGLGEFSDGAALLPGGMDTALSWSFDLELLDFDGDFDLDVLAASRGPGPALALRNAGDGVFAVHPIPALAGKPVNSAFTVLDLNADGALDLVTLQDGFGGGRDTVLLGDGSGDFADNPGAYWALVDNPPRLDFDAASLDFDNDGTFDVVVVGPQVNPGEVHARLLRNDGASLEPLAPDGAAFTGPELVGSFGVQIADLDLDRRDDLAVVMRSADLADVVLFAGADVPEDSSAPRIVRFTQPPDPLLPGQLIDLRASVYDARIPAPWHAFRHDPQLAGLHLVDGAVTAHQRRLPRFEFAVGLADPGELAALPDDHPEKWIAPGEWYGESLWRFAFHLPGELAGDQLLTWRLCAIDAADNKGCTEPFNVFLTGIIRDTCGDGQLDPGEDCDDPENPLCVQCILTCGNCFCERPENPENCPEDCAPDSPCTQWCGDGECQWGEDLSNCPEDCPGCGDGECQADETRIECPWDCHVCGDCICDTPMEDNLNCPEDCALGCETDGNRCGDGLCDAGETPVTCPDDCGVCGDGTCDPQENPSNCCVDCGGFDGCPESAGSDSATTGGGALDDGCGCRSARGDLGLGLVLLLARRRRRAPRR